jgi:hypothetical protein
MNKKSEAQRRELTVKFRVSRKEKTRLQTRADQWTNGDVSALIRHAIETMRSRPQVKARAR